VDLLIHKAILGTEQHLLTDPVNATIQWCSKMPETAWVVGDAQHPNSIEILLDSKNIFIGDVKSDLTKIIINEINKIK